MSDPERGGVQKPTSPHDDTATAPSKKLQEESRLIQRARELIEESRRRRDQSDTLARKD